ncbi:hypothetical protein ABAC460_22640 [Asticcacaulis sp. AC460]|uniref:hypothetical protein n=1 Tax=Asticcacaulis sp. AC460 TaxID=1282360 RepID=UPI0003C3E4DF|nr:hypothetical protein [Asticcacaulis sp. AC460]ESQ86628.1 hypothetical protein ABAC460_22640 [Asticcacaulis sp. AC460]
MIRNPHPWLALAAALTGSAASPGLAQTELFSPETVKAWVDVRLTATDGERGWLDGGFGKTRYGGNDDGAHLAQAVMVWQPRLADTVTAYVIGQYVPESDEPFGIEEAFVKWKPVPKSALRYSVRAGQFFPPVSLEHDGAGWTTTRTVTPSAINSWIGEEVLVQGLEGNLQTQVAEHGLALTLGGFTKNDTSATILTWRGWALHDISASESTGLPLPDGPQGWSNTLGANQSAHSRPLAEVDGRLGYYVRLDWRPPAPLAVDAEFYDNQGDPQVLRNGQWGWATRFYNLGVTWQPAQDWEVLGQYMTGQSNMGWRMSNGFWAFDVKYDSAYLLATRKFGDGSQLTGRIDYFAVKDLSWRKKDDNTERGHAATVAWIRPLTGHLDLAAEVLHVNSYRPARAIQGLDPRQAQTQVQIALKAHL